MGLIRFNGMTATSHDEGERMTVSMKAEDVISGVIDSAEDMLTVTDQNGSIIAEYVRMYIDHWSVWVKKERTADAA